VLKLHLSEHCVHTFEVEVILSCTDQSFGKKCIGPHPNICFEFQMPSGYQCQEKAPVSGIHNLNPQDEAFAEVLMIGFRSYRPNTAEMERFISQQKEG